MDDSTHELNRPPANPAVQWLGAILWPSFIMSGLAAILFFAAFDPVELLACNGYPELNRIGAYTVGFFLLWLVTSISNLLALYFRRPCPSLPHDGETTE